MIQRVLMTLGVAKATIAVTIASVLSSVGLYMPLSVILGEFSYRGVLTSILIPAIIAPILSYQFVRMMVQLILSEQNLQRSEEKHRIILESIDEGYFEVDLAGNLTFFNDSVCRLLGHTRDELQGMNYRKYVGPGTAEKMYETFNQVYSTGASARLMDYEILREDGSTQVLEMSVLLMKNPLGEPTGFRGIARDITDRKRAEEALLESEKRYRKLYDESRRAEEVYRSLIKSSADAIVIYDLEGKARYVSHAFTLTFGWSQEEVEGRRIPFVPDAEMEATMAGIKEIMEEGKAISDFETKRHHKDGRVIDVSISGSRYDDHVGRPAGMLVILRDISEKKRLQVQLQQAQKMEAIGTLAGGIAHDFNNLLMAIQGNVSLMLLDVEGGHPHHVRLRNIEQQVKSGARLSAQLLGYARKGKYEVKAIDLNSVVEEISDAFGRTKKEISIERKLSGEFFGVEADQGQMEQLLLNLFINAADAMPGGGKLTLNTLNVTHRDMGGRLYRPKPGNYVLLKVTDTGVGMDAETQKRIFDPFFTTKELGRGTGLGLASVYGIVKGHGGYIDVDSSPESGSTFSIYLPASAQKMSRAAQSSGEIVEGSGKVLLVDDEQMVLDVGAKMLESLGYGVLEARGGREAVEVYQENKEGIDLVILDMVMPQMGGGEVYDRMKEINPQVKVLLSSGYSMEGQASEILKRGCDGFIQKPFGIEEISGKIREILLSQNPFGLQRVHGEAA